LNVATENCHSERSEESAVCSQGKTQIPRFTRDDKAVEKLSKDIKVNGGGAMYTGTLIDDLISSVERAEKYCHQMSGSQETSEAYWYTPTDGSRASDSNLLGVA
jgi:hypothetical protein